VQSNLFSPLCVSFSPPSHHTEGSANSAVDFDENYLVSASILLPKWCFKPGSSTCLEVCICKPQEWNCWESTPSKV